MVDSAQIRRLVQATEDAIDKRLNERLEPLLKSGSVTTLATLATIDPDVIEAKTADAIAMITEVAEEEGQSITSALLVMVASQYAISQLQSKARGELFAQIERRLADLEARL